MPAMSGSTLPDDAHPIIQAAWRYWHDRHPAPESLPGRQHIDPLGMPQLLPYIWLLEVHPGADKAALPRLRYRLLGSHVDLGFGGPKTGLWMEEVEPRFFEDARLNERYLACIRTGKPDYRRGAVHFAVNGGASSVERLLMPLASDGKQVDMLFGCSIFFAADGRELRAVL